VGVECLLTLRLHGLVTVRAFMTRAALALGDVKDQDALFRSAFAFRLLAYRVSGDDSIFSHGFVSASENNHLCCVIVTEMRPKCSETLILPRFQADLKSATEQSV
jgi:hypothetical protein